MLLAVGLSASAGAATQAAAAPAAPKPLTVASASLSQSAQRLVWTVTLTAPFAPGALARDGRSLCLLIAAARDGAVTGQLCVLGPAPGRRAPRLQFAPVTAAGPGKPSVIAAAVTRGSSRSLTASFLPGAIGNDYVPVRWQVRSTLAAPPCVSPTAGGSECAALFPARPALTRLHTPRLVGCIPSGPRLVYSGPSDRREIALTFDDGPWYQTAQFLTLLERYHAPATFFEIGRQISSFGRGGAIERRMLADGDMIGDHTWSHPDLAGAGVFARRQIERTAAAIRQATGGFAPCLFRAPYGALSPALLKEARSLGFTTIQWNIDPRDWAHPGVAAIEANVLANARPGGIVELHDGGGDRAQTLAALPDIIMTLRRRGYQFVTVTQLLRQRLIYR